MLAQLAAEGPAHQRLQAGHHCVAVLAGGAASGRPAGLAEGVRLCARQALRRAGDESSGRRASGALRSQGALPTASVNLPPRTRTQPPTHAPSTGR